MPRIKKKSSKIGSVVSNKDDNEKINTLCDMFQSPKIGSVVSNMKHDQVFGLLAKFQSPKIGSVVSNSTPLGYESYENGEKLFQSPKIGSVVSNRGH